MRQIRHTGVFVSNLDNMKEFYCNNFKMTVAIHDIETGNYISRLYGLEGEKIQVELYKLVTEDENMIELLKIVPERMLDVHSNQVFNLGCSHIALTVFDLKEKYRQLKSNGIHFFSQPLLSRDKKHLVCFCKDPEGNYLELVEELS